MFNTKILKLLIYRIFFKISFHIFFILCVVHCMAYVRSTLLTAVKNLTNIKYRYATNYKQMLQTYKLLSFMIGKYLASLPCFFGYHVPSNNERASFSYA